MTTATRRELIRGIFGLAALAVTPGTLKPLTEDAVDRFIRQARTGVVENQHFLIDRTLKLVGMEGLTIRDCVFEAAKDFKGPMIHLEKGTYYLLGANRFIPYQNPLHGRRRDALVKLSVTRAAA